MINYAAQHSTCVEEECGCMHAMLGGKDALVSLVFALSDVGRNGLPAG